jgi:hypothetical protein
VGLIAVVVLERHMRAVKRAGRAHRTSQSSDRVTQATHASIKTAFRLPA